MPAMSDSHRREEVLAGLEPLYYLDYALFTGAVRHYVSITLEAVFKADRGPLRRRLHFVNLLKEEYAAYEDVGAMLDAFLAYKSGRVSIPLATLMNYKAKDVLLLQVFDRYKVSSGAMLYDVLKLGDWIPDDWPRWFPRLDLEKSLKLACNFFYEDCTRNQKKYGVVAYNKIKHGLLVVPSGKLYLPELPDAPAVLFPTDATLQQANSNPVTVYGFQSDDAQIEERHRAIEFVQCNLRALAALYVMWRYPRSLAAREIADPKGLFERGEMADVRHLIEEVTTKR
jgi:hypothetical protein